MILRQYTDKNDLLRLNEAFFRKSVDPDFKTIIDWLKSEEQRLFRENRLAQDNQFKQNQGGLQALGDFLNFSSRWAFAQ